jgi:hypothetical protein
VSSDPRDVIEEMTAIIRAADMAQWFIYGVLAVYAVGLLIAFVAILSR